MITWRIHWACLNGPSDGTALYPEFTVHFDRDQPKVLAYSLGLPSEANTTLYKKLAAGTPIFDVSLAVSTAKVEAVRDAVIELNVQRLSQRLRVGLPDHENERLSLTASSEDIDWLCAIVRAEKDCVYQRREERERLCEAAGPTDNTRVGTSGLRVLAPTTRTLCAGCSMPPSSVICSHLMRPQVVGFEGDNGGIAERRLVSAMCAIGSADIVSPGKCRPGGNACWERLVEEESPIARTAIGPLALHHAIDHLDLAWRAWRGNKARLFEHRNAEHIGGLSLPCTSRAEMGQRMNELDAVLKSMTVPESKLDPKALSLVRLDHLLKEAMTLAGAELSELEHMSRAIGSLRRMNSLRVALEHVGNTDKSPSVAFVEVGLTYPVEDWGAAWESMRRLAVDNLLTLADAVNRLSLVPAVDKSSPH